MKKICTSQRKKVNLAKPTSVMPSLEGDSSSLPATREFGAPSKWLSLNPMMEVTYIGVMS